MKKMILLGVGILLCIWTSFDFSEKDSDVLMLELALENIEAIASIEDSGTPIEQCTKKVLTYDTGVWFLECDQRTTTSMMYSCPIMPKEGGRGDWFWCRK